MQFSRKLKYHILFYVFEQNISLSQIFKLGKSVVFFSKSVNKLIINILRNQPYKILVTNETHRLYCTYLPTFIVHKLYYLLQIPNIIRIYGYDIYCSPHIILQRNSKKTRVVDHVSWLPRSDKMAMIGVARLLQLDLQTWDLMWTSDLSLLFVSD